MRDYYRRASMEQRRKWIAGRDPKSVQRSEQRRRKKREGTPEHRTRQLSRNRALRATQRGTLVKEPCVRCGDTAVQAHHEDYAQPLQVIWLCTQHHALHHRERADKPF